MSGLIAQEGVRFLVTGCINTALTWLIYLAALSVVGYSLAYTFAYAIGIVIAYVFGVGYVFRTSPTLKGFLIFPMVYLAQYLAGLGILWVAVSQLHIDEQYAIFASIIGTIPLTFALSRLVLFRAGEPRKPPLSR